MSDDDTPYDKLEPEQERAAETLDRNVSLMAGAGTGKTTTLTARYLQILEHELREIDDPEDARRLPERILTTTFTERAADDLKRKVRDRINDRLSATTDPETYASWRAVADEIDAGYVHTLHGFCHRLLVENVTHVPVLEPGFETLDEADAHDLQGDVVQAILERPADYDLTESVERLAVRFDRSSLHDFLTGLLANQDRTRQWCTHIQAFDSEAAYLDFVAEYLPVHPDEAETIYEVIWPTLKTVGDIHETYDPDDVGKNTWKSTIKPLVEFAEELPPAVFNSLPTYEQADVLSELCHTLTTDGSRYSKGWTHGKGSWRNAGHADADAYVDAIDTILDTLEPAERLEAGPLPASTSASLAVDAALYDYLLDLAELANKAVEAYQEEKQERDTVDFDDQVRLTFDLLSDLPATRLDEIREQFRYVMVDEFQDTNPRQWALVKTLTSEQPEAFDAKNVFLVGDVKQSIYRFRDADVTVFSLAEDELETANTGNEKPHDQPPLATNFRTLPETLSAINGLFELILGPDDEDGHAAYEAPPEALRAGRDNPEDVSPVVEYIPVPEDDLREPLLGADHDLANTRAATPAALEAEALASRLAQLLDDDTPVYREYDDPDPNGPREYTEAVEPSDIAILLRSRGELKAYERALRNAQIPFTVIKGEGFYETPEIRHLRNLLKTLADPHDDRSLYASLRSPLFGQPDTTLATLAAEHDTDHLWNALTETTDETLTGIHDDLQRWRRYAGTHSDQNSTAVDFWTALLSRILEETGYLAAVSADERGDQALPNIEKFRQQLRGYTQDGVQSLPDVVRRIERAADRDTRESEANAAIEDLGVQVLTVHEAKGQEYPIVAVPGIGRQFNDKAALANGRVEFETIDDTPILGLKGPDPEEPLASKTSILRAAAKTQRKRENRAEEKRVLYVAATRARDHLLLTGRHKPDSKSGAQIPVQSPSEPEDARCWRDWVQPALFGDEETAPDVWTRLANEGTVDRQLDFQVRRQSGSGYREDTGKFTLRLPPQATSYETPSETVDVDLELSSCPEPVPWRFDVSPHELSLLAEGDAEFVPNDAHHRYVVERTDDEEREAYDGPSDRLGANIFGEAVHRLCELQPPRDEWRDFVAEVMADEALKGEDTDGWEDEFDAIATNAERGIQFVDDLYPENEVVGRYDELELTHELDAGNELPLPGQITGKIDHLTVTEDAYHIVDYKTNRRRKGESVDEFVDRQTSHHSPQLAAYATVLDAMDPSKAIRMSLVFTQLDTAHTWDSERTNAATDTFSQLIETTLDTTR